MIWPDWTVESGQFRIFREDQKPQSLKVLESNFYRILSVGNRRQPWQVLEMWGSCKWRGHVPKGSAEVSTSGESQVLTAERVIVILAVEWPSMAFSHVFFLHLFTVVWFSKPFETMLYAHSWTYCNHVITWLLWWWWWWGLLLTALTLGGTCFSVQDLAPSSGWIWPVARHYTAKTST